MPWQPSDAQGKTRKANTPRKKRQWQRVANSTLERTGDEGRAIREANAVVAHGPGRRREAERAPVVRQTR